MSLGVDDYLAWSPAKMSEASDWLKEKSEEVRMSAQALRKAAADGTAGQCGDFIASRRAEAADMAHQLDRLSATMEDASTCITEAKDAISPAVDGLRSADLAMRDAGFERTRGDVVTDTRTTFEDSAERQERAEQAEQHEGKINQFLNAIRTADTAANGALHEAVDREVRDRTARGNGALPAVLGELLALRGDHTTVPAALGSTVMEVLQSAQDRIASSQGVSFGWWNAARGGGPVLAVLGFAGAVANAPDDEPVHETLLAEGAGTIGGIVGSAVGFLAGGGPNPYGFLTHFAGGVSGSQLASSYVRETFDRAN